MEILETALKIIDHSKAFAELIPGADIYTEGHIHTQGAFINDTLYIDRKRQLLIALHAHFVTTGHFLIYENSYAQDYKFPSRPMDSSLVTLIGNESGKHGVKKVKDGFFLLGVGRAFKDSSSPVMSAYQVCLPRQWGTTGGPGGTNAAQNSHSWRSVLLRHSPLHA